MLLSAANALAQTRWQGNGTEQSPYRINSTEDLEALADSVNSGTSYAGKFFRLEADLTYDTATQNNHTAIGTGGKPFKGTFDGNNHTISGIRINNNNNYDQGLFGRCENSTVKNLMLTDARISGKYFVGGIVGINNQSSIEECLVANNVNVSGDGYVGGIAGDSSNGSIVENCHVANNVTVSGNYYIGGIAGFGVDGSIEDCQVANNVTIIGVTDYGTIVGYNDNSTLHRNYYHGCTVNGVANATDVGTWNGDITENNGAVPGYLLTLGEHITSDAVSFTTPAYGEMPETTYHVAPSGDTITLGYEPAGCEVTYYINGEAITGNTFIMPAEDVNVTAVWTDYTIHTAADWELFCDALQDNATYNRFIGDTVRLAADITVTRMAGSSTHDFMGTFDGQGHTLTIAYGSAENPLTEDYAAPFHNVENGCVIENLHVVGTITTANKYVAGIVAQQFGAVTIRNCRSSVTIQSSVEGDGTHGGLVGVKGNSNNANLTIEGCTFDGKIVSTGATATTNCGGFVGWRSNSGTLTITNSLYAPTADNNAVSSGATFARNWTMPDDANCYYTETMGAAQGKLALTNPAVLPVGEPTATYDVSSLTLYGNGIQFGEVFYYDTERNFLRTIAGYGTGDDGWNLVASPVANGITPTAANGFLTEAYDLFRFNQAADLEWENWKDTVYDNYHYDLASGRGYLYASQTETTLVFSGTPYSGTGEVTLTKTDGIEFSGWNLVGNPFATAKTIGSKPFYRMNDLGTEIIAAETDTIAAMEGIFVVATTDGETVTFAEPTRGGESEERIIINLCDNAAVIDRAIVRLGEGEMLPKLQIRKGNTKVYIPQGGEEYAIVCAGRDAMHCVPTEIPVNFKAKEDGTYTISINPEVVEMGYLHLIDNLTGADVDLLTPLAFGHPLSEGATPPNPLSEGEAQSDAEIGEATAAGRFPLCKGGQGDSNPTYTFTAKTTDYESRFKLVFNANAEDGSSTGSASDEAFAFISNGQLILTSEGSLQVFDALGRQLFAKDVTTFNSQLPIPWRVRFASYQR